MQKETQQKNSKRGNREDRLKVALKANMAKRKAQARLRSDGERETSSVSPGRQAEKDR